MDIKKSVQELNILQQKYFKNKSVENEKMFLIKAKECFTALNKQMSFALSRSEQQDKEIKRLCAEQNLKIESLKAQTPKEKQSFVLPHTNNKTKNTQSTDTRRTKTIGGIEIEY